VSGAWRERESPKVQGGVFDRGMAVEHADELFDSARSHAVDLDRDVDSVDPRLGPRGLVARPWQGGLRMETADSARHDRAPLRGPRPLLRSNRHVH
jgi:hypothetical protein